MACNNVGKVGVVCRISLQSNLLSNFVENLHVPEFQKKKNRCHAIYYSIESACCIQIKMIDKRKKLILTDRRIDDHCIFHKNQIESNTIIAIALIKRQYAETRFLLILFCDYCAVFGGTDNQD